MFTSFFSKTWRYWCGGHVVTTIRRCYMPYSTRSISISVTVKNKPTIRQTLKKEITAWNTKTVMENIMCYSIHNLMMSTICSKKSFTHFQQTTSVLFENQIQRSTWDTLYKLDGLASFIAPAKALLIVYILFKFL